MRFIPKLASHLQQHGIIYTVRRYQYSTEHTIVEADDFGSLEVTRRLVSKIFNLSDLEPFVSQSGFSSTQAWWDMIRKFIPLREPMFLYEVKLDEVK